jgi:hypothetical protein
MQQSRLIDQVTHIYYECAQLTYDSIGYIPETAGNVAIFCQTDEEYNSFQELVIHLVKPSDNPAQKYFQLINPISIEGRGEIPPTILSWLYIRKPSKDTPEAGDIDFVLEQEKYDKLKEQTDNGDIHNGSIYKRAGWDMVELKNPNYDCIPYITILTMAEKVRLRF